MRFGCGKLSMAEQMLCSWTRWPPAAARDVPGPGHCILLELSFAWWDGGAGKLSLT